MLKKRKRLGFTLIEIILVIILVGIITGITGNLLLQGAESYTIQADRRELMYLIKLSMMRMDKEIRMIKSASATDILTYTATDLKFNDINGQTIEFKLNGTDLLRNADTLAEKVSALTFAYLKKDGAAAAVETDIWSISISVTVTGGESITMRTRVFLRDVHGKYISWKEI